ncbi:MAG: MotA/TolQ/ExbB proton channel family protein [Kiritimatiellae bacterium]|nr:MotA/TolQ/ExbB proton channel family protein [Kiritimatiellia bacterium]
MMFVRDLFVRGGPIMWPLLVCSLVSLTITIERILFLWRERSRAHHDGLVHQILGRVEKGAYDQALALQGARVGAAARILLAGLADREHGLHESLELAAEAEIERMKRGLPILDTVITMAPLLGILGTVTGIIDSFDLLGKSGIQDPKAVTGGIAQALITTAAGLAIALITLVPFNYLVARVQRAARHFAQVATQLEMAYRRGRDHAADDRV